MSEEGFEKFLKVLWIILKVVLVIVFSPIIILYLILIKAPWQAGKEDADRMRRGEPPKWAGIGDKNFMNPRKK